MKFLTLNTHSWLEVKALDKLTQLAQTIRFEDYDVIALQEVNQSIKSEIVELNDYFCPTDSQTPIKQDNYALRLIEELNQLGVHYYWSWTDAHIGYNRFEEGSAVLTKQPQQVKSRLISQSNDPHDYHTRKILLVETQLQERQVMVVNGHFSWWIDHQDGFAYEWQKTERLLAEMTLPLIVMGDLNNPAHLVNQGYDRVMTSSLQLQDAYKVASETIGDYTVGPGIDGWRDNQEDLRIDYVLLSEDFVVERYRVMFDGQHAPVVSDHFGVGVKVIWREAE